MKTEFETHIHLIVLNTYNMFGSHMTCIFLTVSR